MGERRAVEGRQANPSVCLATPLLTDPPIAFSFEESGRVIAFLPGFASRVEIAVTHSKQTVATFLPGSRIARCGLRQDMAFYPDLRRAAVPSFLGPVYPDAGRAEVRATQFHNSFRAPSIAKPLSDRELELLEPRLTLRKQTIAPRSNRELSTNRCRFNSHAAMPVLTFLTGLPRAFFAKGSVCATRFLTGSGMQTKFAVTHSKKTTAPFLTGSRIVTKRLVSRTVFHLFLSEHFPTHRRISLRGRIARLGSVASEPRMHAPVGRR